MRVTPGIRRVGVKHLEGGVLVVTTFLLLTLTLLWLHAYVHSVWWRVTPRSLALHSLGVGLRWPGNALCWLANILWCWTVQFHACAVWTDPGSLSAYGCPEEVPHNSVACYHRCGVCQRWKPPRAYHCRRCGACIFRMDHHCFWIGNCIGLFNVKFFLLFLCHLSGYPCVFQRSAVPRVRDAFVWVFAGESV